MSALKAAFLTFWPMAREVLSELSEHRLLRAIEKACDEVGTTGPARNAWMSQKIDATWHENIDLSCKQGVLVDPIKVGSQPIFSILCLSRVFPYFATGRHCSASCMWRKMPRNFPAWSRPTSR